MRRILWMFISVYVSRLAYSLPISNHIEIPEPTVVNGTQYTISTFSPKVFVKTDEFALNYTQCAVFKYKLMDKKVRLRAYTCQLSEGGFCTLDKFAYPKDTEGCGKLRPWSYKDDSFSFYFVLEKRARKYGAGKTSRKGRKLHRRNAISADPIGHIILQGIVPCNEACVEKETN